MIRVLLADDHALVRTGMRSIIDAEEDLEVVAEAANGCEVVAQAASSQPDVVLMDLTMPKGGGIDAIAPVLRAAPKARVLAVTMHSEHAYAQLVMKAGGAGYLVKQAGAQQLCKAIRAVHEGRSFVDLSLTDGDLKDVVDTKGPAEAPVSQAPLSPRERQVLELLARGHTHKEIGEALGIGMKTAQTYRGRIAGKLGVSTRADLVRYALQLPSVREGEKPSEDDS